MQMVHSPCDFATGSQSCWGIQTTPPRVKGTRANIREHADSLLTKRQQGIAVEAVARRDPYPRIEPMAAKNLQAGRNPLALFLLGNAGKLRFPMQRQPSAGFAVIQVPIAVQSDHGPCRFKGAHFRPELRRWR